MNVFADLARPILSRPGAGTGYLPPAKRTRAEPTPEQKAKRATHGRRPNAHLPFTPNPWGCTAIHAAILGALIEGLEARAIADRLDISVRTVENHLERIKDRMGDISRTRCVVLWDRFTRQAVDN